MLDRVLVEPLIDTPVKVVIVSPNETAVEPIVIDELTKDPLPMFVRVLLAPLMVLLVSVSTPARVARVPESGKVTLVAPVVVRFRENAPVVVKDPAVDKFPPTVMVLDPLSTPVPPLPGAKMPPKMMPPEVGVLGVRPVDPPLKVVTPEPEMIAPQPMPWV